MITVCLFHELTLLCQLNLSVVALASLLSSMNLTGTTGALNTTDSQHSLNDLLSMLSSSTTPTPSTTPLPGAISNDPIASMFSHQTSPTQGMYCIVL